MKPLKDVQDDVDELKLKVKELEYEIEKLKNGEHVITYDNSEYILNHKFIK